jgi:hypothetical protein
MLEEFAQDSVGGKKKKPSAGMRDDQVDPDIADMFEEYPTKDAAKKSSGLDSGH